MKYLTYYLSMTPREERPVLHLSQYDTDFTFEAFLYSERGRFSLQEDTSAYIMCKRPDGEAIEAAVNLTASTLKITLPTAVKSQLTQAAGRGEFTIELRHEEKFLHTEKVIFIIEPMPYQEDDNAGGAEQEAES